MDPLPAVSGVLEHCGAVHGVIRDNELDSGRGGLPTARAQQPDVSAQGTTRGGDRDMISDASEIHMLLLVTKPYLS